MRNMADRSIIVCGISYGTINRYILEVEQNLEKSKLSFNWTIDKAAAKNLGSVKLPSYKISFTGISNSAELALKKFRKLIFRGGG